MVRTCIAPAKHSGVCKQQQPHRIPKNMVGRNTRSPYHSFLLDTRPRISSYHDWEYQHGWMYLCRDAWHPHDDVADGVILTAAHGQWRCWNLPRVVSPQHVPAWSILGDCWEWCDKQQKHQHQQPKKQHLITSNTFKRNTDTTAGTGLWQQRAAEKHRQPQDSDGGWPQTGNGHPHVGLVLSTIIGNMCQVSTCIQILHVYACVATPWTLLGIDRGPKFRVMTALFLTTINHWTIIVHHCYAWLKIIAARNQ